MHVFDAAQEPFEFLHLVRETRDFFFGQAVEIALNLHVFEFPQARDALLDGRKVRQGAAQPALIDEVRPGAFGLFLDHVLRLLLGADEEDDFALTRHLLDGFVGLAQSLDGLTEVDNVDAVTLLKDVRLHLRIPAAGLVAEVDARFEQGAHGDD